MADFRHICTMKQAAQELGQEWCRLEGIMSKSVIPGESAETRIARDRIVLDHHDTLARKLRASPRYQELIRASLTKQNINPELISAIHSERTTVVVCRGVNEDVEREVRASDYQHDRPKDERLYLEFTLPGKGCQADQKVAVAVADGEAMQTELLEGFTAEDVEQFRAWALNFAKDRGNCFNGTPPQIPVTKNVGSVYAAYKAGQAPATHPPVAKRRSPHPCRKDFKGTPTR